MPQRGTLTTKQSKERSSAKKRIAAAKGPPKVPREKKPPLILPLTERESAYVNAYLQCGENNADTARALDLSLSQATELSTRPKVVAEIKARRAAREGESVVDKPYVLEKARGLLELFTENLNVAGCPAAAVKMIELLGRQVDLFSEKRVNTTVVDNVRLLEMSREYGTQRVMNVTINAPGSLADTGSFLHSLEAGTVRGRAIADPGDVRAADALAADIDQAQAEADALRPATS